MFLSLLLLLLCMDLIFVSLFVNYFRLIVPHLSLSFRHTRGYERANSSVSSSEHRWHIRVVGSHQYSDNKRRFVGEGGPPEEHGAAAER